MKRPQAILAVASYRKNKKATAVHRGLYDKRIETSLSSVEQTVHTHKHEFDDFYGSTWCTSEGNGNILS
jgi:hypothetical protein